MAANQSELLAAPPGRRRPAARRPPPVFWKLNLAASRRPAARRRRQIRQISKNLDFRRHSPPVFDVFLNFAAALKKIMRFTLAPADSAVLKFTTF